MEVLRDMGVKESDLQAHLNDLPPWSQILENYGGKDEPVPWGKHNPEEARGVYEVDYMRYVENPMTVLPVVSIRHPYTWMSAMCRHTYGTKWMHRPEFCDKTLKLQSPIEKVPYGATGNSTHPIRNSYTSLAHMYMDWYRPYFQQQNYHRLMIRFEDLVYRPKEVVTQVCECVGGRITGWKGKFQYKKKTANKGDGHGQRSDLVTAFAKYGQPLSNFYAEYNEKDWHVMSEAFGGDQQAVHGIIRSFKYKLRVEN
ncbi:MAG: hypothetical protein SGARI_000759 [Bacillariaceae sp.]